MKNIIIFGASSCGREIVDTIRRINEKGQCFHIMGFADEREELWGTKISGVPVLGNDDVIVELAKQAPLCGILAAASTIVKRKIVQKMGDLIQWENIIDPTACISPYAKIGEGNIIQPFVYIGSGVGLGNHCTINVKTVIGHDVIIGDYVSIMSCCDITGHVHLEEEVYLGSSVSIIPGKTIKRGSIIGAGATVIADLNVKGTYVGTPAKLIDSKVELYEE